MNEFTASISSGTEGLNVVFLIGIAIFVGTFGARLFQKAHIPQVVGCIVIGILLGGDVLGVISDETVELLRPFTMFALGIIGFMIGGELRGDVFKKYGKQFFVILFSQGFGAFLLVSAGSSLVSWFITGNLRLSVAIGLVLGAIASATAPAATVNVLWEYKTRGPLTAAILAIVALDDALALLLYRGASMGAEVLVGTGHGSILRAVLLLLGEIFGAIFLGFLAGVVLYYLLKFVRAEDKILGFSISSLLLVVGVSEIGGFDPILPAMVFGITTANLLPRQSKGIFELIKKFSPPIYVSFFVLAGAHMRFDKIAGWVLVMIFVYVLLRAAGKVLGSWFGAKYCGSPLVVRKYLGICLLPQAGVAIGLVILASGQFESSLGHEIIMVVMMATFLMEIVGPMLVKVGVKGAGEVGLNITEEDLIKTYKVGDVMEREPTSIAEDLPLHQILEVFSTSDSVYYPVIDSGSQIKGKITIAGIKEMFANQDVAGWLLACDVAEPVIDKTTSEKPLEEVVELMKRYDLEHIPVVADEESNKLVGVIDYRRVLRNISAEVLHRRKQADEMALGTV
ncbi:MAG: cation:proton antiporter domain-containing protein [Planctomycetota bacterium]|jgi:Kef-type K+ transport system membrane component KefB